MVLCAKADECACRRARRPAHGDRRNGSGLLAAQARPFAYPPHQCGNVFVILFHGARSKSLDDKLTELSSCSKQASAKAVFVPDNYQGNYSRVRMRRVGLFAQLDIVVPNWSRGAHARAEGPGRYCRPIQ